MEGLHLAPAHRPSLQEPDEQEEDAEQVAPFLHGDEEHSFTSVAQLNPTKPVSQAQAYTPNATGLTRITDEESVHTPLFAHGKDAHSFTSTSQLNPVKPTGHLHEYPFTLCEQVAEFLHGDEEHSLTSVSQL